MTADLATAQTTPLAAVADTYLKSGSPNQAQGSETFLRIQSSGNNRALVALDGAAIAAAVGSGSLAAASLELFIADNADNWGPDGRTVDAHRLLAAWTEAGATWNCPADANPANASPDCPSQWAGGSFAEEPTDTVVHTNGLAGWVRFDVTAEVRASLAGTPHHGWLVKKTDEGQNGRVDYTSRQGAAEEAPRLVLVVESPAFDEVPPQLGVTAPARSVVVNDPTPEVAVAYADGGSGIDLASLVVRVDGGDITGSCTVGEASATCAPPALAAGPHVVTAEVSDLAGNGSQVSRGFALLLGPGLASATFPAAADTYLRQGQPNQSQGGESFLRLRQAGKNRALVRFDGAEIASTVGSSTLVSASLGLTISQNGHNWGQAGRTVDAHRATAAWTEAGATWNCADDADPANQQPDCDPQWAGGSFEAAPTATALHTNDLAGSVEFDVTADVAALLAGTAHHGWLLKKTQEGASGLVEYASREGDPEAVPRLVVTFSVGGGAPDTAPPAVTLFAPAEGAYLSEPTPAVGAFYSDAGSGIDEASVRVHIDGEDRTAEAIVTAAELTFRPVAALADGPHQVAVQVRDLAGNQAEAAVTFVVDTAAPALAVTAPASPVVIEDPTPAVELAYSDALSGVDLASLAVFLGETEITSSCSAAAAAATCEPPPLAAGAYTAFAHLRDRAGNMTGASRAFRVLFDTQAPSLAITSPAAGVVLGDATPTVTIEYQDDRVGLDLSSFRFELDGAEATAACTVGPSAAQCEPPPLARGSHSVVAEVADLRGNLARAERSFAVAFPVEVAFTSPAQDSVLAVPVVSVTGTVAPEAVAVEVDGVPAALAGGTFTVEALGLHDGVNHVVAVARDGAGNAGTASLRLFADTTSPRLSITSPAAGARLRTPAATVTGLVNDLTLGTVSETEVTVTVNGIPAEVGNRSFLAREVPLSPGGNTLSARATDRAGNQAVAEVEVTFEPIAGAPTLRAFAGDGQVGPVLTELPQPLLVEALDAAGQPRPGVSVLFRVVQGDGTLAGGDRLALATTDTQGRASVRWTLGRRGGVGINRVKATATGGGGAVEFLATATPGEPAAVHLVSGDNQRGLVGAPLAQPLVAVVFDAGDNPVPGVPVTFQVVEGGGAVEGGEAAVVETDGSGLAVARFTLGLEPGIDFHLVEAAAGEEIAPALFKATAFVPGDPAATEIVGVVLDNQGAPVHGVTMRLRDSLQMTATDAQGQFRLTGVPVGRVFLIADASTTSRPGQWASLEFELFTLPGVVNTLERPIYILPLDFAGGVFVDETHGGTVTVPGVPGLALEVAPGSVTFPGGGRSGVVTVTAVHADRIPMAPGGGMQPRLILTIQPAGALFDPPAPLTLPNVDLLAPGRVTELFSFDHDLGAFVAIGTGTVSEDGLVLRSDQGFGILEAGWHCGGPPRPFGTAACLKIDVLPERLFLLADATPPDTGTLLADGEPERQVVYSWDIFNPAVATGAPVGEGLCPNAATCPTTATAVSPGVTTATATLESTITGGAVSDDAKVYVVKVEDVDVHASDPETAKVESNLPTSQLLHFVTARRQGDVVLIATIEPDLPEVRDKLTWQSAAVALTSPAVGDDKRTVRFSSDMSIGLKIPIDILIDGNVARRIVAWVVSATVSGQVGPIVAQPLGAPSPFSPGNLVRVGTRVSAEIRPRAVIHPPEIIFDQDRPDLSGPNVPPPLPGTNTCGKPLNGGVATRWDISRRIAIRASSTTGVLTLCLDQTSDMPSDPVTGNDDAAVNEPEFDDPYNPPYPGSLVGQDIPNRVGPDLNLGQDPFAGLRVGAVGDTYESALWFEEFARLQLGASGSARWYVISDPLQWRVFFQLRKQPITERLWQVDLNQNPNDDLVITEGLAGVPDLNGNGTDDALGFWDNDGSISANDNVGRP